MLRSCLILLIGTFRPGVDAVDRWLVMSCWGVPSLWNAVAETAVRDGIVDGRFDGRAAPWRRAFVLDSPRRVAVIVASNMRQARIAVVDERYAVLGAFERTTNDPNLITDHARGYSPLSHLWPIHDLYQDGRVETLVALEPTYSGALTDNLFAYLALGAEVNELLLACRLRGKRSPPDVVLDRTDFDGDSYQDVVVYPYPVQRVAVSDQERPWMVFRWDPRARAFEARSRDGAGEWASCWCKGDGEPVLFRRNEAFEDRVTTLVDGATSRE